MLDLKYFNVGDSIERRFRKTNLNFRELWNKITIIENTPAVAGGNLLSKTLKISDTDIDTLNSVPLEIIPLVVGATPQLISVLHYTLSFDSDGGFGVANVNLKYTNGETIPVTTPFVLDNDGVRIFYPTPMDAINLENSIDNSVSVIASADTEGGSGTLEITVYYTIQDILLPAGLSDKQLKDNITVLNTVKGLELATWTWNEKAAKLGHTGQGFGVIAQQAQTILPEAVIIGEDGYLRVNYTKITQYLK